MFDQLLIPDTSVKETLRIWTDTTLLKGVTLLYKAVNNREVPDDETWRVDGGAYWTWFAFRGNFEAACRLGLAAIAECVGRGLSSSGPRASKRLFEENKGAGKFAALPYIFHTEEYQAQVKKVLFQYGKVEAHMRGFLDNRGFRGTIQSNEGRIRDSWSANRMMDPYPEPRDSTLDHWQRREGYDVGTNPYEEFGPTGLTTLSVEVSYNPWNEIQTNAVAMPAPVGTPMPVASADDNCNCTACERARMGRANSPFSVF